VVDASITLVDRGRILADLAYVVDGASMASHAAPDPDHDVAEFVVWNAVVDHPEGTFLWDTGSHPEAGEGHWPPPLYEAFYHVDAADHHLSDDLAAAGYSIPDAGGLEAFAGTDVPVYVHAEELKYAYYSAKTTEGSLAYVAADFDHDLNWSVVHGDSYHLAEDVELLHLPGHTPGMLGAQFSLPDGTVLFVGDLVYDEANWTREASLSAGLLSDGAAWHASLRGAKDRARRTDADVLFGHDLERFESFGDGWGH
jgi:glyoxylase-like metal-dependent hydrolase (beta-lactamase superfamily II)